MEENINRGGFDEAHSRMSSREEHNHRTNEEAIAFHVDGRILFPSFFPDDRDNYFDSHPFDKCVTSLAANTSVTYVMSLSLLANAAYAQTLLLSFHSLQISILA